jgi:ribosomal-protein-alanine N-acetyltransferase
MVGVMEIRTMEPEDLPAVLELERTSFSQPWDEEVLRTEIVSDNRVYLVAEVDGTIVGYGGLLLDGDEAHIVTLASSVPRQGLGTRLMLGLVDAVLDHGARHLTLEVRMSNKTAQDLYRKFGMVPVGVRSAYYGNEDALVMWAHDVSEPDYRARVESIRKGLQ